MSEITRKKLGCCTVCDAKTASINSTYGLDHPCAGEARSIGKHFDSAVRATLILSDGKTMDITVCAACDPLLETSMVLVWKRVMMAWRYEIQPEVRAGKRIAPYTDEQLLDLHKWVCKVSKVIPLGVLYRRSWKDVK